MVQSSVVTDAASKFQELVAKAPEKFSELNSNWKGHSFEALNQKVTALVGDTAFISDQMATLATICAYYEEYCAELDNYNTNLQGYEHYKGQVGTVKESEAIHLEKLMQQYYDKMMASQRKLEEIVKKAQGERAKFNAQTMKEVSFQSIGVAV